MTAINAIIRSISAVLLAGSKNQCYRTLRNLGFRKSDTLGGDLHKDYLGFECLVWIHDDYIKLSVYGKGTPISDDAYIGPPLPGKRALRKFVKYNAG